MLLFVREFENLISFVFGCWPPHCQMLITTLARRSQTIPLRRLTSVFSANSIYSIAFKHTRSMSNSAFEAKPFRLSLVQLGGTGDDKAANLEHAKEMVLKAAQPVDGKKTNLIVLPECFNSPYGHMHFPNYAETIGYKPGEAYDVSASKSESVKALSTMAKETGIWLLGGMKSMVNYIIQPRHYLQGRSYPTSDARNYMTSIQESETLTGGTKLTSFETGCVAMLYPGAFNLTTGPLHWELLQRARAVDNQIYVAMCSPARDMSAGYHAVIRKTRSGIPVTIQRRFDVYPDVSI
ncbi:carbon-nitrogen hydrolase domain-containing protein [Rhizoctonia solani AG-1 IA]|uniref:Carbon-nitrogen hydrolase domain-containing protein n=1 Tax=Thanatephorus cucumeris (strain AG1-IA) TaxID=983506 RepID=L8X7V8_THACA|nr:carbon-nitrogen hydrolase domain-containing protein [Rhizoctonia solani AG-1 IA]